MGRKSQRKGRRAEFEVRDILRAAGWDASATDIYDTLDILWAYDGRDHLCEVKRRARLPRWIEGAFEASASVVFMRGDRGRWRVIFDLDDFIRTYGPEPKISPDPLTVAVEASP